MAQLIGFIGTAIFLAAVIFYAHYILRRLGGADGKAAKGTSSWPSGWRLAFLCIALVLTVIVLIPAVVVTVGYAFGLTDCSPHFSPSDPWRCSPVGRLLFLIGGIVIGLPLAVLWTRLLLRLVTQRSSVT
jgi:hypothetical protein